MIGGVLEPWHLIVILAIVLVVFGPGKLPEIGGALGKGIREFKSSTKEFTSSANEVRDAIGGARSALSDTAGSASNSKICSKCSSANPIKNRFCANCGAEFL